MTTRADSGRTEERNLRSRKWYAGSSTDITTSIGDTITLQARINDGDALVTSGKVAFKLNGNTLEDDSGNLIFVDVVNGIATLDYTINSDFGNDSYELTAVFENMLYYRASDSAELTIEG